MTNNPTAVEYHIEITDEYICALVPRELLPLLGIVRDAVIETPGLWASEENRVLVAERWSFLEHQILFYD